MTSQNKEWYRITALTNLHAGSGDQNYGIVDKLVQRDPVTRFPIIHASSLKGALKEYCEKELVEKKASEEREALEKKIQKSFGDEKNPGTEKFFSAHLLTLPVRSNVKPYFKATCPIILKEILEMLKAFNISTTLSDPIKELSEIPFDEGIRFVLFKESREDPDPTDNLILEEFSVKNSIEYRNDLFTRELSGFFNCQAADFVLIRDDVFLEICENLPVVVRNRLDREKNLWYEELVPRQSTFYFFHVGMNSPTIMDDIVVNSGDGFPVQIGANASVGYGYCRIEKIG
jgi:CRISPR-associated protein Cmr4